MPTSDRIAVQDIEEPALDVIELLNMLHELANVLDGTRRYTKLLTNGILESSPLRVYAESVQAGLNRMCGIQTEMLDSIKREFPHFLRKAPVNLQRHCKEAVKYPAPGYDESSDIRIPNSL